MNEPVLTEDLCRSLVARLRELEPWMQISAVHEAVARCSELLEHEMQIQYVMPSQSRYQRELIKSRKPAIAAAKTRTSFLSLPAELRTRIYELVVMPKQRSETEQEEGLVDPHSPAIPLGYDYTAFPKNSKEVSYNMPQNRWAFQPAITRTSRQVRREALPVYYSQNEFITSSDDRLTRWPRVNEIRFPHALKWLKAIGPENRKSLRTISIRGGSLNYRWVSARRFLALIAKEGIDDIPEGAVKSFYIESKTNQFGRPETRWVEATSEIEELHSDFGDEPEAL